MNGSNRTERLPPGGADDAELELPVGDALDHGLRVVHLESDANGGVERWNSQSRSGTTIAAGPVDAPMRELAGELAFAVRFDLAEQLLLELKQALRAAVEADDRPRSARPAAPSGRPAGSRAASRVRGSAARRPAA